MNDIPIRIVKRNLLTVTQAAELLGMHPDSIRRLVRCGKLPDRRPPGTRKIHLYTSDLILEPAL